jgi:carboxyl-terminal processing protease
MVDVVGWRVDDVVDLIRGAKDTVVRLEVISEGDGVDTPSQVIDIVRGEVKLEEQAASSEIIEVPREGEDPLKIGVIDLPVFYLDFNGRALNLPDYRSSTRDVRRLIEELQAEGVTGLIIDLRNNGGGSLLEATTLTGLFIDQGPVVQVRNNSGRISTEEDTDPGMAWDGPLAVLVNRYSASASEIFAAAIQDYARGIIIGQQTFGKGTVQNLYSLDQYVRRSEGEGLGQLTLTVGKYYRVTGESTQHRGVQPDIPLPSPIDAEVVGESARDSALPWDTIRTTRFRAGTPLNTTIASLNTEHLSRSKDDPDYRYLLDGIQDVAEVRARESVSLNIEARRKEREDALARRLERENARRAALGLDPLAAADELDELEEPDVHLDQAAAIVTDLVEMRQVEAVPARTARIQH